MKLRIVISALALMLVSDHASAKEWREIVPLMSTRADVERRFGKPDKFGFHELKNERVSFHYADEPCNDLYLPLGEDNCKCLVAKDTVMSIFVEPTVKRKFSVLKLEKLKFQRTAISPFPHRFQYSNETEGIVYTVDESDDEVRHITYYPSVSDCQNVIKTHTPTYRNSWRGLVPLHGTRSDIERLLGTPKHDTNTRAIYLTDYETVSVNYSKGKCGDGTEWNVPEGTILELVVSPRLSFLITALRLDPHRWERKETTQFSELQSSPNSIAYTDQKYGIIIRTQSNPGQGEEVGSITYQPALSDARLRCN